MECLGREVTARSPLLFEPLRLGTGVPYVVTYTEQYARVDVHGSEGKM